MIFPKKEYSEGAQSEAGPAAADKYPDMGSFASKAG